MRVVFITFAISIGLAWVIFISGGIFLFIYHMYDERYLILGIVLALVSSFVTNDARLVDNRQSSLRRGER